MSYYKKQKKHTRSIYLNTDEAFYVNPERTSFTFRLEAINIEDESRLYVKNTIVDYSTGAGLGVKSVKSGLFIGSTATYEAAYTDNPTVSFVPKDGKGDGATGIGLLAPSGLSGSATATTTTVAPTIAGGGYTGTPPTIPANIPLSGGYGATLTPSFNATTGALETATLVAGSAYEETPTFTIPAPQASVAATFGAVPYTASTGVITGVPTITNPTTNGFYNGTLFTIGFKNNSAPAEATGSTNATGGFTNITITNPTNNGYFGTDAPPVLATIGGDALFGSGFTYTPVYTNGCLSSITINSAGSGYGNNRTNQAMGISGNGVPTPAMITGKTIVNGRLTGLTFGSGGAKYRNPTIQITAGLVTPVQGEYASVFQIPAPLAGVRILTHGKGYTQPPTPVVSPAFKFGNDADLPLITTMAPTQELEGNRYFTIKMDGFKFTHSLYNNCDNKGLPTIAVCSTSENVNNEQYNDLFIPAQVVNEITLTIQDRSGSGLEAGKTLQILIDIEELGHKDTEFKPSKRQDYYA